MMVVGTGVGVEVTLGVLSDVLVGVGVAGSGVGVAGVPLHVPWVTSVYWPWQVPP